MLRAAILHGCQNYLAGGGGLRGSEDVDLKIKILVTVRRGISKRSHEKIGDCEQSRYLYIYIVPVTHEIF